MAHDPDPADLLRDAHSLREAAARDRERARKLAARYARRVREKWAAVRAELLARRAELDEARGQLSAEAARFHHARTEYATRATEETQRLRAEWDALDAQRRRLHAEWTELQQTVGRQEAGVAAREKELATREKALAAGRNELGAQSAAARAEAAGLDERVKNARAVVAELEERRDKLHAELLAAAPKPSAEPGTVRFALARKDDQDLAAFSAELDAEALRLGAEKAKLAALRKHLDAEQFVVLAKARGEWQGVERAALTELETLTHALRQKEQEHAAREDWLVRSDARRREEGYELWQLRLRLEAWQSKLVATERRWHAEREARDADYARRLHALLERETGGPLAEDELPVADEAAAAPPEGTTLREEFERMAVVLLKADLPEPPDGQLPWGSEEAEDEGPSILPFRGQRAA